MPFFNNNELGVDNIELNFGYGDIGVFSGVCKEDAPVGVVLFRQLSKRYDIGDGIDNDTDGCIDADGDIYLKDHDVIMTFDKVESIDVVIKHLEHTKKIMTQKNR